MSTDKRSEPARHWLRVPECSLRQSLPFTPDW